MGQQKAVNLCGMRQRSLSIIPTDNPLSNQKAVDLLCAHTRASSVCYPFFLPPTLT